MKFSSGPGHLKPCQVARIWVKIIQGQLGEFQKLRYESIKSSFISEFSLPSMWWSNAPKGIHIEQIIQENV